MGRADLARGRVLVRVRVRVRVGVRVRVRVRVRIRVRVRVRVKVSATSGLPARPTHASFGIAQNPAGSAVSWLSARRISSSCRQ